jgi:hypothetical protein
MTPEELRHMTEWIAAVVATPERIREMAVKGGGLSSTTTGDQLIAALAIQLAAAGVPMAAPGQKPGEHVVSVKTATILAALALEAGVGLGRGYEAYRRDAEELERMMRG